MAILCIIKLSQLTCDRKMLELVFSLCIKLQVQIWVVHLECITWHLPIKLQKRLCYSGETQRTQKWITCSQPLTPLKWRAIPDATAPHTVLNFPPFTVSQFWLDGARLKLSLSWVGRDISGSSQYRPPHCSSQLGMEKEKGKVNIKQSPHKSVLKLVKPTLFPSPWWWKATHLYRACQNSSALLESALG